VQLLNQCLRQKLREELNYSKYEDCYYFKATPDLSENRVPYERLGKSRRRSVFKGYESKRDPSRIAYYRHFAFSGHFRCYGSAWYLEITPTYYFTRDGHRLSRYHEERLSGIKRLERNPNVLDQVLFWKAYLTKPPSLFAAEYPFLKFVELQEFRLEAGINDEVWLGHEEEKVAEEIRSSLIDLPLFRQ
jgi:hypothetical protein